MASNSIIIDLIAFNALMMILVSGSVIHEKHRENIVLDMET